MQLTTRRFVALTLLLSIPAVAHADKSGDAAKKKPAQATHKARAALAKKNPCYRWFYNTKELYDKAVTPVMRASNAKQPCQPMIETFKSSTPPIPADCSPQKLKDQPETLANELNDAAEKWNSRDWNRWEVLPEGTLDKELGKVTEFLTADLYARCSTPVGHTTDHPAH